MEIYQIFNSHIRLGIDFIIFYYLRVTLYNRTNIATRCVSSREVIDVMARDARSPRCPIMRKCFSLSNVITLLQTCTRTDLRDRQRYSYVRIIVRITQNAFKDAILHRSSKEQYNRYIYFLVLSMPFISYLSAHLKLYI